MLSEEGGDNDIEKEIDSLYHGPCASCDSEADYFKLNPPKRNFTPKMPGLRKLQDAISQIKRAPGTVLSIKAAN